MQHNLLELIILKIFSRSSLMEGPQVVYITSRFAWNILFIMIFYCKRHMGVAKDIFYRHNDYVCTDICQWKTQTIFTIPMPLKQRECQLDFSWEMAALTLTVWPAISCNRVKHNKNLLQKTTCCFEWQKQFIVLNY